MMDVISAMISYNSFSKICRLCLVFGDLQSVFQTNIIKIMQALGDIEIKSDDELPSKVCNNCVKQIENVFSFIDKCKASDHILRQLVTREKEKILYDSDISNGEICDDDLKMDMEEHTEDEDEKRMKQEKKLKPILTCRKCKVSFTTRPSLSKHYRENVKCRPKNFKIHTCEQCKKDFRTSQQKKEHMNVHTGATPYICSYCGKGFKFHSKLYVHVYRHKLALGEVEKKEAYTEKRVHLNLKCEKCGKVFASRSGHARHMLRHQGIKVENKKYASVKIDRNNRPYLCNFCAKSFYIKANLDSHLRVHTGERPFHCNDCGKQFKQKGALDRHTLSHLDERPKPFSCEICQKSFTTKAHMEIHKRLHNGEKPYTCGFCSKSFNYRSYWRIHLRMHTGESPYYCPVCNNRYHDRGSMRKHQKKKGHFIEDGVTVRCQIMDINDT